MLCTTLAMDHTSVNYVNIETSHSGIKPDHRWIRLYKTRSYQEMAAQNPANYDTILYRVRPGDSLSRIIQSYHGSVTTLQRNAIISQIRADNPGVTNPSRIYPDQLLQLSVPQQYCSASTHPDSTPVLSLGEPYYKPLVRQWDFAAPQEKEMLATLTPLMLGTGAASMTMIKQTFTSNAPLLNEMVQNYEAYKAGNLSKGQYDYRRYKILTRLKAKLGPLSRMLNAS
ncbi:MAG TPA: LysM domain-containing protein, partial [Gammaproteobacteria bacterium]|nr:LysM domain-containing protein [Gammaproteobacteria bacterium]